jgi:hypothetical protein
MKMSEANCIPHRTERLKTDRPHWFAGMYRKGRRKNIGDAIGGGGEAKMQK